MIRTIAAALAALSLAGCATPALRSAAQPVTAVVTSADGAQRLSPQPVAATSETTALRITVDPDTRHQTMVGFGASITDASAILIDALPQDRRDALIRELFGRGEGGLGLDFTRLTIGASDFSPTHYSFDDMPAGERDPDLRRFSIDPNRADVLPVLKSALAVNPDLVVMASPWSPPGWMKTSDSMIGGTLRPDAYDVYARYFARYLQAYRAEGVAIRYLTIQNEPDFSPTDYPGMKWPAVDRARFVGQHLGPLLEREGLATRILDWDHNWDQPEQPLTVLRDPAATRYVAGTAWHCYAGNVSAQTPVHEAFPDRETFFTECSGGEWRPGWATGLSDAVGLMIDTTRGWAKGVLLWNLALDPRNGPQLGGCRTCRGVVRIDPATGAVEREVDYYALGHLSRFVRPGARRIGSTSGEAGVKTVAFRNADDGSLVLLAFNSAEEPRPLRIEAPGRSFGFTLAPGSAATFAW
jgi:glucosylceramidase